VALGADRGWGRVLPLRVKKVLRNLIAPVIVVSALLAWAMMSGCVRPGVRAPACEICAKAPPCDGDWIAVDESDGGGCMIVIAAGGECPE